MYTITIEAPTVTELQAKLEDFAKIIAVDIQSIPQQVAPTPAKKATRKAKEEVTTATPTAPQPVPPVVAQGVPIQPQAVPVGAVPQGIPISAVPQEMPVQQGLPTAPQPVPPVVVQGVPIQPQAVPVGKVSYTKEELAHAGTTLVDRGLMPQLVDILTKKYGVRSISDLAPEQYGNFAIDLRNLGAQI